jgi:uncharacterized protein YkwD
VLSSVENSLINAHNEARVNQGLAPLTMNPTLMSIARTRAQYMAQVSSMTHYGPSGATVFTMMNQQSYAYGDGAENIHFNSGFSESQSWQTAMSEYLASPSHRTAIMKPGFRRIGVAVATSASGVRYYSVVALTSNLQPSTSNHAHSSAYVNRCHRSCVRAPALASMP